MTTAATCETHSWQRRHRGGAPLALAIWLNGRCEASVYESGGSVRTPARVACGSSAAAMEQADAILKKGYPHECAVEGCGAWEPFLPTPAVCGC